MRVERIAALEQDYHRTGRDNQNRQHLNAEKSIRMPESDEVLHYVDAAPSDGDESYFYRTRQAKDQIVLHYTIGYLPGDISVLTKQGQHVSVAFVIGRNGVIYNLFPSYYWSYHLGRGAVGGNANGSKRSVGIELSNIGPLSREGGVLNTYYGDAYCNANQQDYYTSQIYRGYDYFATFTDAQYEALGKLVRYLAGRYDIPRQFLREDQRYSAGPHAVDFSGILSHVNFRSTGKWDIGPAFNWSRLEHETT